MRTANAFGGSFAFTVAVEHRLRDIHSADTSKASGHIPLYVWDDLEAMRLPEKCTLVGVELTDEAIPLPSFRHPLQAAYLFGPERGSLSQEAQAHCSHIIRIPTHFCVNVAVACAVVLYDRMISVGTFEDRPVMAGGPPPTARWQPVREKS